MKMQPLKKKDYKKMSDQFFREIERHIRLVNKKIKQITRKVEEKYARGPRRTRSSFNFL